MTVTSLLLTLFSCHSQILPLKPDTWHYLVIQADTLQRQWEWDRWHISVPCLLFQSPHFLNREENVFKWCTSFINSWILWKLWSNQFIEKLLDEMFFILVLVVLVKNVMQDLPDRDWLGLSLTKISVIHETLFVIAPLYLQCDPFFLLSV